MPASRYKILMKELFLLSIPTVLEQIMSTLLQYVDTAMVGRLGERATAAVSTTTTVTWLTGCVPFAVATASLALISRENGAGHRDQVRLLTGQTVTLSLISGLLVSLLCMALSPFIPVWMNAEEAVRGPATEYFFIVNLAGVFKCAGIAFGSVIRSVKDTRTPMRINLVGNLMNLMLNYFFIYTLAMGVRGAAIATAISYTAIGILMFIAMRKKEDLCFARRDLVLKKDLCRSFADIGLPSMATGAASCLGYVFFAGLVSGMGTTTFAAHSIAVTAEQLFYIPGYGFRTATSTLIGNALGEGDNEKMIITERLSIAITTSAMFLSGLVLFFIARPLMGIFTPSEAVVELGAAMLRIVAFTEPLYGLMIVLEGIFYGYGRTRNIFFIETGSMWGIRILFTFLVAKVWHLSLAAVWLCMIADNICKALLLLVDYLRMVRARRAEA